MNPSIREILESRTIEASAPCRVDMGGTLDLASFHYPLARKRPMTVNMAVRLRTRVRLSAFRPGQVKIASTGFTEAVFPSDRLPFDHPLGLMFAICAHFGADGVFVEIDSESPPRSSLGGSSVAAVALTGAFLQIAGISGREALSRSRAVRTAHAIEQSVAMVPCGLQDQLAAAYGGINAWTWIADPEARPWERREISIPGNGADGRLLLAYCGVPHDSSDVNSRWVRRFLAGEDRERWNRIITLSNAFADALENRDWPAAAAAMNEETGIRREMTPDVLTGLGVRLVQSAVLGGCGARFTGAGGGGCLYALGEKEDIDKLRPVWKELLFQHDGARLLKAAIDDNGLICT